MSFWCAIVLIVLTSCVQKEDMTEVQEDICPFMIELDTLNALDVGFIYVKKDDMMEEYDEAGIIYCKKTESSSQNEIALYMKGSDDSSGECRTTIQVEPESEYAWRPYTITGDVRKLYNISTFKVGKSFSAAYLSCEKGAVQLDITVPFPTEVSYMCVKNSQEEITREVLWANGTHRTFMKEGRYYVSA